MIAQSKRNQIKTKMKNKQTRFQLHIDYIDYRVSELEIENEKLRKDILLLRNSIDRGIAEDELEGKISEF